MSDKKNIDLWEEVLENPPESYKKWFEKEKQFFFDNIKKDSTIIEIGCGDGRALKELLPITKKIVGIDYDEKAIKDAKITFKNHPEVKLIVADGKNIPFEDNSFDYVISMGTFTNFGKNKYLILKEMKRILKKDGNILLSCYSEDAFEERIKVYKKSSIPIKEIKSNNIIFDIIIQGEPFVSEQFTKKQLIGIFNKVELKIDEIIKVGIGYICKLRK